MNPRIIRVESPKDILYPCERKLFEDPRVVYHGTSNVHASAIERDGWAPNALPYDMPDIEAICRIYESLKFDGFSVDGYAVLRTFTLGTDGHYSKYKPASFSGSYWRSRNYASQPAGETIASIIRTVDEIERLVKDDELLKEHRNKLQSDLDRRRHYPAYLLAEYKDALDSLDEPRFLNQCLKKVRELKRKYEALAIRRWPVVYAVSVEPQWFEKADSTEWYDTPPVNRERSTLIEIISRPGVHILSDAIVARIDFPNGVAPWLPFYGEVLPLPWLTTHDQAKEMWDKYHKVFGGREG